MLKRQMPPAHPGGVLKELFMEPLEIGVKQLATHLDVAPKTISALVNGHQGISIEMALRLSKAFNTSTEVWINMQRDYDLWYARKHVNLDRVHILKRRKKNTAGIAA